MKTILSIYFALIAAAAISQPALITFQDGTQAEVHIQATSSSQVFTRSGNIYYQQIKSVQFKEAPSEQTEARLKENKIEVLHGSYKAPSTSTSIPAYTPPVSPVVVTVAEKDPINLNFGDMERFRKQRNVGKALQLIGMLTLTTTSILTINYNKENKENVGKPDYNEKHVNEWIPVAALGVTSVGIYIDLNASSFLKKK